MIKGITKAIRDIDELEMDICSLTGAVPELSPRELEDNLKDLFVQADAIRKRLDKMLVKAAHE